MTQIDADPHRC